MKWFTFYVASGSSPLGFSVYFSRRVMWRFSTTIINDETEKARNAPPIFQPGIYTQGVGRRRRGLASRADATGPLLHHFIPSFPQLPRLSRCWRTSHNTRVCWQLLVRVNYGRAAPLCEKHIWNCKIFS